jgi:hypothetical protein
VHGRICTTVPLTLIVCCCAARQRPLSADLIWIARLDPTGSKYYC